MADTKSPKAESGVPAGCGLRHERLSAVEVSVAESKGAILRLEDTIERLGDKVAGLGDSHRATLTALEANTAALTAQTGSQTRLSESIDLLGRELHAVMVDVSAHKRDLAEHVIESERDKRSLPRLAISVWLMGLSLGALALYFIVHNWQWLVHTAAVFDPQAGG